MKLLGVNSLADTSADLCSRGNGPKQDCYFNAK